MGRYSLASTSLRLIGGIEDAWPLNGVAVPERGKLGVTGVPIVDGSSETIKRTRYRWNWTNFVQERAKWGERSDAYYRKLRYENDDKGSHIDSEQPGVIMGVMRGCKESVVSL